MADEYDHAGLKELAKELDRPLYTLEVLSHDPFTAGAPARKAGAEWFASLWNDRDALGVRPDQKLHLHGFHYILVSQSAPVQLPNGSDYENTTECEGVLIRCALDARYLELVSADDFSDQRSVEPTINDTAEAEDPWVGIIGGLSEIKYEPPAFEIPKLEVSPPKLLPHDQLEAWIEKSTQNEWLGPLCEQHGINFQPGVGEFSLTRCLQLVQRAEAHHPRPTRVGIITDFDPAGQTRRRTVRGYVGRLDIYDGTAFAGCLLPTDDGFQVYDREGLPIGLFNNLRDAARSLPKAEATS